MSESSSLTPQLDVGEGLQAVGLGQYVELFRELEIGWPLCKLCHENEGVWDELFQNELAAILVPDRVTLVTQMPTILGVHAHPPPLGTKPSAAAPGPIVAAPAVALPVDQPQADSGTAAALPVARSAQLPGSREDGTIWLWLEKKSPARGKGWQRRWFVIDPNSAQMHYFGDATKEQLGDVGGTEPGYLHSKGFLDLSRCLSITSNNFASVPLHCALHRCSLMGAFVVTKHRCGCCS